MVKVPSNGGRAEKRRRQHAGASNVLPLENSMSRLWNVMGSIRLACPRCGHGKFNLPGRSPISEHAVVLSCVRCDQHWMITRRTINEIRMSEVANDG